MKDFNEFYSEAISKQKWKSTYKPLVDKTFKKREYAKIKPLLDTLFAKLNGGKPADTIVFDYNLNKDNLAANKNTKVVKDFLAAADCTLDENKWSKAQRVCTNKKGAEVPIKDVIDTYARKKTEDLERALQNAPEAARISIEKQLNATKLAKKAAKAIAEFTTEDNMSGYRFVLTKDPRLVASQSTDVTWESCMTLGPKPGMYHHTVGSGMSAGVFVLYLSQLGDELKLKRPIARILFKPFEGENTKKTRWETDKIYDWTHKKTKGGPYPQKEFLDVAARLKKIINEKVETLEDTYIMKEGVYRDETNPKVVVHKPETEKYIKAGKYADIASKPENVIRAVFDNDRTDERLAKALWQAPNEDIEKLEKRDFFELDRVFDDLCLESTSTKYGQDNINLFKKLWEILKHRKGLLQMVFNRLYDEQSSRTELDKLIHAFKTSPPELAKKLIIHIKNNMRTPLGALNSYIFDSYNYPLSKIMEFYKTMHDISPVIFTDKSAYDALENLLDRYIEEYRPSARKRSVDGINALMQYASKKVVLNGIRYLNNHIDGLLESIRDYGGASRGEKTDLKDFRKLVVILREYLNKTNEESGSEA